MADSVDNLPYRPCVGIMLINHANRVFVGERLDSPGAWQMPQGGVDPGEDITSAFFRELREEIGTDKATIIQVMSQPVRYDLPPDLQRKLWNGAYRGQEQTWIAARFDGTDADINLQSHTPAEFGQWKWVERDTVPDLIVPFKREAYRQVVAAFSNLSI